ncbi:E3 ubiquitin-protein ligase RNF26-like [Scleropages formosus]|nr:E3 ubiquitin-protein ligase RNF26-like [Scleropages formosus]XP_018598291.1 E3 ubiquitin-protein ligase RNF26-like [Scleropages formosus]
MGLLSFFFCTIRLCIDTVSFLLDLNFWVMHSLIRLLAALFSFLNGLPSLLTGALAQCWYTAAFCVLALAEGMSSTAQGSARVLGDWLRLLSGVTEGFKMVSNLSVHVLLRAREVLQRVELWCCSALWQLWEACSIAFSLALYLLNTILNVLLLGVQSVCSAVVSLWEMVCGSLHWTLDLALTLSALLYSGLAGTAALLWKPLNMTLEFLGSLGRIFVSVFLLDLYGLAFTFAVLATAALYLSPRPIRRAFYYIDMAPVLRRLQEALHSLHFLALEHSHAIAELYARQRAAWGGSHMRWRRGRNIARDGSRRHLEEGNQAAAQPALDMDPGPSVGVRTQWNPSLGNSQTEDDLNTAPCSSKERPQQGSSSEEDSPLSRPTADTLLTLLQEQEERKRCVVCQDCAKTVVLLPCRHLCLCRGCAQMLLRLPVYQHNCPLCRHMILQTVDVYL